MADLFFEPVTEPADDTDPREGLCTCENPDDRYTLEIDAGAVVVTHRACGKPPAWDSDWMESLALDSVPIRLQWERECGSAGETWHGDYRCDCHSYAVATIEQDAQ